MIDSILTIITFTVLGIASVTDMRSREVPDWVSYAFIAVAAGVRVLAAIRLWSISPIIEGAAGFAIFFVIGYAIYRAGQWGGGDAKLMMGVGTAIGLQWNTFPTLAIFFVAMLLAGALWGLGWMIVLGIHHRNRVWEEIKQKKNKRYIQGGIVFIILSIVLAVISPSEIRLEIIALLCLALLVMLLLPLIKAVEKVALIKSIAPQQLTEGDWLAEPVVINGKKIVDAIYSGVTKKDMKTLIELHDKGKLNRVIIKNGIAFVPSFLMGYTITVIAGEKIATTIALLL